MKNSKTVKFKSILILLAGMLGIAFSDVQACDFSHLQINSITTLSNGQYEISMRMCAGGGTSFNSNGADQNTGTFGFIVEGAAILSYPNTISSPQTNAVFTATALGTDSLLYMNETEWFACISDPACGDIQNVCKDVTITVDAMPSKIRLLGIEGGGLAEAGCTDPSLEVRPAICGALGVDAGVDEELTGTETCTNLLATGTGSGTLTYSWSTGDNTAAINVCPTSFTAYTVTITNSAGCTAIDNVVVVVNNDGTASTDPGPTKPGKGGKGGKGNGKKK